VSDALRGPDKFDQAVWDLELRLPQIRRNKEGWRRAEQHAARREAEREQKRVADALQRLGLS
jgi:hypothetical protein